MRQKESFEANMANRQEKETSRAEKVRAQRQQKQKPAPKTSIGNSATRKKTSQHVPITRRPTSHTPVINRKRHTMNVPLKSTGAELRLPAFPRFELGWRLISGLIFSFSLAVVISFSSLNAFTISAINLKGAQRLGGEAILSQLDLSGTSIIGINPEDIEARVLENFPSLKNVRVSVGLPASVNIQVVERQPIVHWQQNSTSYWIDSEGVMFPIIGEAEVPLTVIANSNPPARPLTEDSSTGEEIQEISLLIEPTLPQTTPEFVEGILSLSNYIPEGTSLQYDPRFGLGWQDPIGSLVYFGTDTTDIDIKLAGYQTIIAALHKKNITPSMISLEFLHAPFYRLEQ